MSNDEAKELVWDIYMQMAAIYNAPKPRYIHEGERLAVTMSDRIEAAGIALSCLAWLSNGEVDACMHDK